MTARKGLCTRCSGRYSGHQAGPRLHLRTGALHQRRGWRELAGPWVDLLDERAGTELPGKTGILPYLVPRIQINMYQNKSNQSNDQKTMVRSAPTKFASGGQGAHWTLPR